MFLSSSTNLSEGKKEAFRAAKASYKEELDRRKSPNVVGRSGEGADDGGSPGDKKGDDGGGSSDNKEGDKSVQVMNLGRADDLSVIVAACLAFNSN